MRKGRKEGWKERKEKRRNSRNEVHQEMRESGNGGKVRTGK